MHPFLTRYNQTVLPQLTAAKTYPSTFLIPKVTKVVINCGIGDLAGNDKAIEELATILTQVTGQKPVVTKAHKAIAGFKIRQGMVVGMKVTLHGERMQDFLIKLLDVALPRTRDFRGINPGGVTAAGSLNIGIKDASIFPEVPYGGMNHGLQVTVVSTAKTMEESQLLYHSLGFYFQSEEDRVKPKAKKSNFKRK